MTWRSRIDRRCGFTMLEILIAIGIFAMILTGIYATWMTLIKGGDGAKRAASDVQRSRVALRTLHDAFLTALMYTANHRDYAFIADTTGDYAFVSLVSHLPASFPGVARYGDLYVQRISFSIRPGKDSGNDLVMTNAPILLDTSSVEPYSLVLAKNVTLFSLSFYDQRKGEWIDEWRYTNQLPKLVQIGLGLGKKPGSLDPADVVTTIVSLPSDAVPGSLQGGQGARQIPQPGVFPPGGVPPGNIPPGTQPNQPFVQPGFNQPQPVQPGFNPGVRRF